MKKQCSVGSDTRPPMSVESDLRFLDDSFLRSSQTNIFNNPNQTSMQGDLVMCEYAHARIRNMDILNPHCYVRSFTHLKAYEPHAKKDFRKRELSTSMIYSKASKVIVTTARGRWNVARQCKEKPEKDGLRISKIKLYGLEAKEKEMAPMPAVALLANLSSTGATNNPVNKVHSNDNQIFDNVDYQIQEMHQEEHLDSDAETEIDDNTIPVKLDLETKFRQDKPSDSAVTSVTLNLARKRSA
ncbi:hypothetical protein Tco_0264942 [Tanacetum coccineum]